MNGEHWVVVGATSWGLTLAQAIAHARTSVSVLVRSEAEAADIRTHRRHPARAASVRLPASVAITADHAVLERATVALFVVPAQSMRANALAVAEQLAPDAVLVSASKGIEIASGSLMHEVLAGVCGEGRAVAAISGPNLADEIARGLPAATVVASRDAAAARRVQESLTQPALRVYTSEDIVGVELGGALKNIIALGAGICDGLGFGDNAKASLITRGLAEISRLGAAMGADPLTFAGLSGIGDLIATCASPLSRNHRVGEALGRGEALDVILARLGHVAEGVPTTAATRLLAHRLGVTMPIVEEMHRVLFDGRAPADAVRALMGRSPRAELPL